MNKKRLKEWLDNCIDGGSSNIFVAMLNNLEISDIKSKTDFSEFLKALVVASKKWDKEIDKIIN